MKKSFFITLTLFFILLTLTSCRQVNFIVTTEEGISLYYTEIWEDNNFTGKVIMNNITYKEKSFDINKECSLEKTEIQFPKGAFNISGKTVNNLEWNNDRAWIVNCYDNDETSIKLDNSILARFQFGWCNCTIDDIPQKLFIISTVTYEEDGIGGNNYIATVKQAE